MRPIVKRAPPWCEYKPEEVKELVIKFGKEGVPPSKIGVMLRDQYGIPLVKPIVGKGVTQILEEAGVNPSLPEDLNNLLKKAARLKQHLKVHKKDRVNVHSLELLEARIHRLAKYYRRKGVLPPDWKYKAVIATLA
jgi:small subunit ribosomal protein S15